MKIQDMRVGMLVHDEKDPVKLGRIQLVKKTFVEIWFFSGCISHTKRYDKAHCRFLVEEKKE